MRTAIILFSALLAFAQEQARPHQNLIALKNQLRSAVQSAVVDILIRLLSTSDRDPLDTMFSDQAKRVAGGCAVDLNVGRRMGNLLTSVAYTSIVLSLKTHYQGFVGVLRRLSLDRKAEARRNMILNAFTLFHVVLSLVGIVSGFVVLYGLLRSRLLEGWTPVFLITTVATSVTGFLFPVHHFMPSHAVGIVSLIVLSVGIAAFYRFHLHGVWARTYVVSASIALYLNVFVLVAQLFMKVPMLKALAPTGTEPPFAVAQGCVLLVFTTITIIAATRFRVFERA